MTLSPESQRAHDSFLEIQRAYECYDHHHAVAILVQDFPHEFAELCKVLSRFRFTEAQVKAKGGNESEIPKSFRGLMRPLGWGERRLTARLVVDDDTIQTDTHCIDFVKGRVAVDLEWNSKDQTFDRDLFAFRAFFEYRKVSAGVLITRSDSLQDYFASLGGYRDEHGAVRSYKDKYGASTTHIGKLLPRLSAGRSGGCPVLTIGITLNQLEK